MTEPRLAYADRWLKQYGGTVTGDCVENRLALSTTDENAVLLLVTAEEFRELLACVMLGEGLLYPERQFEIRWNLLRGVDCGMDFCARVADCILQSEDVQLALQFWALSQGLLAGSETENAQLGATVLAQWTGTCDNDDYFGLCYEVVARLDSMVRDVFDDIAVYSAQAELAAGLARSVPVVGKYVGAAFDMADFFLTYTATLYNAAYDDTIHEAIACELFCHSSAGTCGVTIDGLLEAFRNILADYEPPGAFSTLLDFASWLATLTVSGDLALVSAVMLVIVEIWSRGSTWIGASPWILQIAESTFSPIDPAGICSACPSGTLTWFGGDEGIEDWTLINVSPSGLATYNATQDRLEGTFIGDYGSGKVIFAEVDLGTAQAIETVDLSFSVKNTRGTVGRLFLYLDGVQFGPEIQIYDGDNQIRKITVNTGSTYTAVKVYLAARTWGDDAAAYMYLNHVEIVY